ncbi:hypothetical protein C356_05747 [Cryptococcus neoformans c45]|nr:hypothetical protein C356_05747 [Cryptococcus neoformans var. grubii c45]
MTHKYRWFLMLFFCTLVSFGAPLPTRQEATPAQVTDVLKISMIGKGKMTFSDEPINNDKRSSGNTHVQKSSPSHSSLLSVTRTASTDPPLPIEDEPSLEEIRSWRKHNGLLSTVLRIFGS